jgi:hypothetical protein
MRLLRAIRLGHWVGVLAAVAAFALVPPTVAAALDASAKRVPSDRWAGSVCGAVSNWLKARGEVETRVSETLGDLAAGDLRAQRAKTRLTRATARGVDATDRLSNEVKSAGTPNVNGGKQIEGGYLLTLAEYEDAYVQARAALARTETGDTRQFAAAAEETNVTLASDLAEVGADPIEELRAVPELASAINASCGDVASYLVTKIDAPCRAVLDTTQRLPDLTSQYLAVAPNPESPQEIAQFDEMNRVVFGQFRTQFAACNIAGLPAPCRKVFQTSQHLAEVWNQFGASEQGSPLEQAQKDELARQADALRSDLQGMCR